MSLQGKAIVFTGTLSTVRTKATQLAVEAGAMVRGSVSGNTDILIAGPGAGAKAAQAEALGVEVWDEDQFLAACKGGGKGKAKPKAAPKARAKAKAAAKPKAKASAKRAAPKKAGAAAAAKKAAAGGALAGMTLCFSGTLSQTRPKMKALAEQHGARVTAGVSGKTTALVAGDDAGSKEDEAEALGVPIWDEDKFNRKIGAGKSEESSDEESSSSEEEEDAEVAQQLKRARAQPKKAAPKKAAARRKAAAVESSSEDEDSDDEEDAEVAQALKRARVSAGGKAVATKTEKKSGGSPKVNDAFRGSGAAEVVQGDDGGWFDCMLNQTNIAQNNNKFYVIQLIDDGGSYNVLTRWGRVGERGMNGCKNHGANQAAAEKDFKSKFRSKTGNAWEARSKFVPKSGKYTLIEMSYSSDEDDDDDDEAVDGGAGAAAAGPKKKVRPSKLPKRTGELVELLFRQDTFNQAVAHFDYDTKKMPLGKLTHDQLQKGQDVLEEIGKELDKGSTGQLATLSSRFYTLIPHSFGRRVPPPIKDQEQLQAKFDMLNALDDVVKAQNTMKASAKKHAEVTEVPHPNDVNFASLKNDLEPLEKDSQEYEMIERYTENTRGYRNLKIIDVFTLDRQGEDARFAQHADLDNRKLLWHGTNIGVVVAILQGGLRIMPHSGGRVGRGLYFASENQKSSSYVGTCMWKGKRVGVMFLNEVALGKEHQIKMDDPSLRAAPPGYDSVHAIGVKEPNPEDDEQIEGSYGDITVPTGVAINNPAGAGSRFLNSEYLVYKESQVFMKYLILCDFS